MGNLKEKLASFMYGRYGIDQLYYAIIAAYFVLGVTTIFIHSPIIRILMWADVMWMIFRLLSRNISKRRMENEKFIKLWNPIKAKGILTIRSIKEAKTHRFRTCPHCKKVLRLPRSPGKHAVNCPCCHKDFEVRILL